MKKYLFGFIVVLLLSIFITSCFSSFGGYYSSSGRGSSNINENTVSVDVFEEVSFDPKKDVFYIATKGDDLAWATRVRSALTDLGFSTKNVFDYDAITEKVYSGTAFFIGDNTLITSSHIILDPNNVSILYNGEEVKATVLLNDENMDIAVLKVDVISDCYFNLLSSSDYKIADSIYALGYPMTSSLGNNIRVTNGSVSALSGLNGDTNFIQISAPIQPGNSGGPVINADFGVVGVVSSKISDAYALATTSQVAQNVNFAVKSDLVNLTVKDYKGNDKTKYVSNMDQATSCTVIVSSGENKDLGVGNKYLCVFSYNVKTSDGYFSSFTLSIIDISTGNVLGSIKAYPGKNIFYDQKTTKKIVNYLFSNFGFEMPN